MILDTIGLPEDIKVLSIEDLRLLAAEIRGLLIETVLRNGGHLASNLGVVELTIALYKVFDFPHDKLVWDVGHQSYVHKILSGRAGRFSTLRQAGGISGFPKRDESPYDAFNTGHSSTSISAALGIARARDIGGGKYKVLSVTGDGALTGGLCYEAMNDAGRSPNDLIVILNDNNMSISGNVGGISRYLNRIRSLPGYFMLREDIHSSLNKVPLIGRPFASFISKMKNVIKYALIPGVVFEEMGFKYIGPVDGHDIGELVKIFKGVSSMGGPVLVHVLTKKGMGYLHAEDDPQKYHGVSPRSDKKGGAYYKNDEVAAPGAAPAADGKSASFSQHFGDEMVKLAQSDASVAAVSAAMTSGVGLDAFAKGFPDRFFDVGIAEQHALTLAAGMSLYGLKPVVALYSTFLQRAYDQALHDICLQNARVVIAIDRAGIVGEDGETHQGLYDMAFLRHMPNITVLAPAYDEELARMLRYALYAAKGPVALRYPKGIHTRERIVQKLERLRELARDSGVRRGAGAGGYGAANDSAAGGGYDGGADVSGYGDASGSVASGVYVSGGASEIKYNASDASADKIDDGGINDAPYIDGGGEAIADRGAVIAGGGTSFAGGAQLIFDAAPRFGLGELLSEGGDITIIAVGAMLEAAIDAACELTTRGYGVDLISARFVKPLDERLIGDSVRKTGRLLVVEDGCKIGGFGGAVAELLSGAAYAARFCGYPDAPVGQGSREQLLEKYGLDAKGLLDGALELLETRGARVKLNAAINDEKPNFI